VENNNNKVFVKVKVIKKTEHLFGIQPSVFKEMLYEDVLMLKLKGASEMLEELLKPHYLERDNDRINDIIKAINYTKQLLQELNEKD